jgi:hypothetical protein
MEYRFLEASGFSNFSGRQLMKSLSVSDRYGYARYVANQAYYSRHVGIWLKSVAGVLPAWLCARRCLTTVGPANPSRRVSPLSILAFPERL